MLRQFPELPGWTFDAEEVSAGVYRAFGRDLLGRNVEATGLDPDALIEECRRAALKIMADAQKSSGQSRGSQR